MNGELAINNILCNNATFRAHVGTTADNAKVYYDIAPQTAKLPYTILSETSVEPNPTKDNGGAFDFGNIVVRHFANGRKKVADMARDARAALDRAVTEATYNSISVISISFLDQNSNAEEIEDNIIHVKEQEYKIMTR